MCIFLSSCCVILLYALPGCAVYLPMLPLAPVTICTLCYCITFVVRRKAFRKWKQKKWNKTCPEVIMYCYTSCGYAKWFQKHSFLIVKDSKWGKNKRLLNLRTSLFNFLSRSYEVRDETDRPFSSRRPTSWFTAHRQQHPSLPVQLSVSRRSQKNFTGSPRHHFMPPTGRDSLRQIITAHGLCGAAVQEGICWLNLTSVWIFMQYIYTDTKYTWLDINHKVHLIFTGCLLTGVYSVDKILNKLDGNSQHWAVDSNWKRLNS